MNELFTLNETAKVIWENLNEGIDMSTLIQTITDTFDIDRQTAEKDIAVFLQTLEAMLKK
ncbi:hypothetical protein SDC9_175940 [bioreactor metagenome]|uniref:PqqD family protein n=1 Tax=bioreactor metagenome TaxID=1076179 RepID=A0A645GNK4_9ZZZZ